MNEDKRRKANEVRGEQPVIGHHEMQVQPLPLEIEEVKTYLTKADIDKFFPKQNYCELKSTFNQST